jgi:hypothetical protein
MRVVPDLIGEDEHSLQSAVFGRISGFQTGSVDPDAVLLVQKMLGWRGEIGDATFAVKSNHAEIKLGDTGEEGPGVVCSALDDALQAKGFGKMRIEQLQQMDIFGTKWLGIFWADEAEPGAILFVCSTALQHV